MIPIIIALATTCIVLAIYAYKLRLQLNSEKFLHRDQNILIENFKNISNEVLLRNHNSFLNIAKQTFDKVLDIEKIEYNKKQNEFKDLITPIKETLQSIEKERISTYTDLRRQIKDLMSFTHDIHKETSALNKALSSPFMSGQWGEMQLRRVVEITGMLPYCDFVEQKQCENSRFRPDMVIRLPGNRNIIVDAKAPLDAYMNAVNGGDNDQFDAHAKRIRAHIRTLGQKAYWEQFEYTPEFVLMFLPGEAFFSSAVKRDPTLIEYGITEKVIITTPITLIAVLKAISFSWQQEAIAVNAKKIGEAGKIVVAGLDKLFEYSKDFERKMVRNVEEYGKINTFIEKTITPAATKLKNLGLEVGEQNQLE